MGVPLLTQICEDVTAEQIHKQLTDGKLNTRSANVTDVCSRFLERWADSAFSSFIPLVMFASSGFGKECKKFYSKLTELISLKRKENYSTAVSWLKEK